MVGSGVGEAGDNVGARDAAVGDAGQQVAGVVIEPVEDFGVGAIGELPVGEVRLPAFVGLGGFKAAVRALGAFAWLRGDQAVVVQDAPDRRGRGRPQTLLLEMPLQGHRSGIESVCGEPFTGDHDRRDDIVGDRARVAGRAAGPGIDSIQSAFAVSLEQSVNVLTRQPMNPGGSTDRQVPRDHFQHHDTALRHEPRLSPMTRLINGALLV